MNPNGGILSAPLKLANAFAVKGGGTKQLLFCQKQREAVWSTAVDGDSERGGIRFAWSLGHARSWSHLPPLITNL